MVFTFTKALWYDHGAFTFWRILAVHPRTERLRKFMADNKLKAPDVARLLNRRPQLVRQWRCESPLIPEHSLELLELKVARERN